MKIGMITDSLGALSFEELLDAAANWVTTSWPPETQTVLKY
jgi:hypothetical protein